MGTMPVVTAPYIGDIGSGQNLAPSGLLITLPNYTIDLGLLKQKQKLDNAFAETGEKPPHGLLQISGRVETQAWAARNTNSKTSSDINVTDVELDFNSQVGDWVTAFIGLKYDGGSSLNGFQHVSRINHSRVFVDKAFITIGNLNKTPFYGTIGQKYVSFGQYANPFVTRPFTRDLFRTKARQISVSYQHPGDAGAYASLFTFRGDSRASQNINQLGGTLGYEIKKDKWGVNVGADYITHIGDSDYILGAFNRAGNQNLVNRVPGVALHGKFDVGPYTLLAEYITATTRFNSANASINGVGAKPSALHVAAVYKYTGLWGRSSDIAIGYNQARDTQPFSVAQRRWNLTHNIVILKNTILGLEYRRDWHYSTGDIATVQSTQIRNFGGFSNTLTAQLTYMF